MTPAAGRNGDDGGDEEQEPALGYVKGVAFIDLAGNGLLDASDPGLNDVEIKLDGGGLQLRQFTPASGSFSFDGLGAGVYDLYIEPGAEWHVTTPRRYKVNLQEGNVVMGGDFGLSRIAQLAATPEIEQAARLIRLPSTGFTEVPSVPLVFGIGLALAMLGAAGAVMERRRR